jgi:Toprim-like
VRYDRDAILARTDLGQLADELLGGHKGSGTGARWPSPVPGHPQTGKTPPMTIFRTHRGVERWTCWATGTSGTAIDLLVTARGLTVAQAFEHLAARAGTRPVAPGPPSGGGRGPTAAGEGSALSDEARHDLLAYVEACEEHLWSSAGKPMRRWLVETRRLDPDVLRVNRVGADPGPAALARADGLPRGRGVTFPVLDHGEVCYVQLRRLGSGGPKYTSPAARRFGPNPRVAEVALVEPSAPDAPIVVAEGPCDALTVAGASLPAVALLGAAMPNTAVARRLAQTCRLLVLALDGDAAGAAGTATLNRVLKEVGSRSVVDISIADGCDLNSWSCRVAPAFSQVLRTAIDRAAATASASAWRCR